MKPAGSGWSRVNVTRRLTRQIRSTGPCGVSGMAGCSLLVPLRVGPARLQPFCSGHTHCGGKTSVPALNPNPCTLIPKPYTLHPKPRTSLSISVRVPCVCHGWGTLMLFMQCWCGGPGREGTAPCEQLRVVDLEMVNQDGQPVLTCPLTRSIRSDRDILYARGFPLQMARARVLPRCDHVP